VVSVDRRAFLELLAFAGISPMASPFSGQIDSKARQSGEAQQGTQSGLFDQGVFDFWTSKVRNPYQDYLDGVTTRGGHPEPTDATFVFPSNKGLVPAGTLAPTDIDKFPENGDMDISVHVERFRPSATDAAALVDLQTGTLRIDVKQVTPMVGLPEALSWTAMATLASRQKGQKIPSLDNVKFDPGTVWGQFQKVPLTEGLGFWSWNFFMKKREAFWGQLLDQLFKTLDVAQPLLPLLGLPGIAVSGLKYVDQIVGTIQAQGQSQWMFKGLDVAVCATNKSFDDAGAVGARKLILTNGTYVVLPENSVSKLDKDLVIQDGLLVPPKTPPLSIYDAAKSILPEVTYMTISVAVSPSASKSPGQAKPSNVG
jgi:hypothetical protein